MGRTGGKKWPTCLHRCGPESRAYDLYGRHFRNQSKDTSPYTILNCIHAPLCTLSSARFRPANVRAVSAFFGSTDSKEIYVLKTQYRSRRYFNRVKIHNQLGKASTSRLPWQHLRGAIEGPTSVYFTSTMSVHPPRTRHSRNLLSRNIRS